MTWRVQNPKTLEIHEIDEQWDEESQTDVSRQAAIDKGYVPVVDVVNPKTGDRYTIDDRTLGEALEKGYQTSENFDNRQKVTEDRKDSISEFDSGVRGLAQGASFGLADEITGAVGAVKDIVSTDKELSDYSELYKQHRDSARDADKLAQEANPNSYMVGDAAGSVGTAFVPGLGWMNAAKGAKAGQVMAKAALAGGIDGAGRSEQDSIGGVAKDAATNAAITGALGGAVHAGTVGSNKVRNKVADYLRKKAGKKAFESTGVMKRDLKNLYSKSNKNIDDADRRMIEIGQTLLDEDIVRGPYGIGNSVDDMATRSSQRLDDLSFEIGDTLGKLDDKAGSSASAQIEDLSQQLDELIATPNKTPEQMSEQYAIESYLDDLYEQTGFVDPTHQVDYQRLSSRIQDEVIQPNQHRPQYKPAVKKISNELDHLLDETVNSSGSTDSLSLADSNKLKHEYFDKFSKWDSQTDATTAELYRKTRDVLNDEIEGAAKNIDKDLFDKFIKQKKTYGDIATIKDVAADKGLSKLSNRDLSLTDHIVGGSIVGGSGYGVTGDPATALMWGAAGVAGNNFRRNRGNQTVAVLMNKLSKLMHTGKYGPTLKRAAERGTLPITHYILSERDPEYRRMLQDEEE